MHYIVGLTGGIGSGKSTIADYFAELNVPIVDADIIARDIVETGSPLLAQIHAYFGDEVLNTDGGLNRTYLRQRVFADENEKAWLNALLHPAIREEMLQKLSACRGEYVLWVVPLLIENRLTDLCDRILVVDVSPDVQLKRASARDKSKEETIKQIINAQVSRTERLRYANDVIDNSLPLHENEENLRRQVAQLHQAYLQLAQQKRRKHNDNRKLSNL